MTPLHAELEAGPTGGIPKGCIVPVEGDRCRGTTVGQHVEMKGGDDDNADPEAQATASAHVLILIKKGLKTKINKHF